jgi:hypothetical protein
MGFCLTLTLAAATAQSLFPPPYTNTISHGTNTFDYAAFYSNNLASVSGWLHDTVTNVDGTPATSLQDYADLSATAFSTSGAFDWVSSQHDAAMTWATFNGLPTEIDGPNGNAYIYGYEGNVPEYIASYDIAADISINTTNVWSGGNTGFNLNGTNRVIGQWDEGLPLLTHSELTNRISIMDGSTNLIDHSTAVAGMMIGGGVVPVYSNSIYLGYAMKGMAYSGQVKAWSYQNDVFKMTGAVNTNHIRLSNHSYGAVQGWYLAAASTWYWLGNSEISTNEDPKFGNYTTNAANYDAITFNAPTYLQVWAAGNSLSNGPSIQPTNHYEINLSGQLVYTNQKHPLDGDAGGYNSLSQESCAKDTLVVGAVNSVANGYSASSNLQYAYFTSCGPTGDGRIKPDVGADGVNNILPLSSGTLAIGIGSGTSFAAPGICGSIALLEQFYSQLHTNSSDLLASTLKALVIETADSGTTNNGPSYRYGYGLMNTKTAALLINADATNGFKNQIKEVLINNGQYVSFPVVSKGGTNNPLKVTICWTDPPGTPNAITNLNNPSIKLVNDLDLRIVSSSGTTNFPWILNPDLTNKTVTARSAAATTGDDSRNNVEQVYIANPVTNGIYTVNVTHKGTLTNSQWVSIVISGNVAQQRPPLAFNQILQTATNTIAVGWPAVVGGQYQIQSNTDLKTTNWVNTGGIISARLTNVVAQVSMPTNTQAFYRLIQQ